MEIGVNMFQFVFAIMQDKNRVLNSRPWVYDNSPLVILPQSDGLEIDQNAFNKTWIWVQIQNLPLRWITKDAGRKIASVFLSMKKVIVPNSGSKEGKHLKILAEIDLNQPMLR